MISLIFKLWNHALSALGITHTNIIITTCIKHGNDNRSKKPKLLMHKRQKYFANIWSVCWDQFEKMTDTSLQTALLSLVWSKECHHYDNKHQWEHTYYSTRQYWLLVKPNTYVIICVCCINNFTLISRLLLNEPGKILTVNFLSLTPDVHFVMYQA